MLFKLIMYVSIKPYIHPKLKEVIDLKNKLFEISNLHDGPIHILVPEIMDENIREFSSLLRELKIDYSIRFAHKSNKSPSLVRQAKMNGIGIDVASYNELVSALSNGFTGAETSCSGPKNKKFILLALYHNCMISIDSVSELQTIMEISKRYRIKKASVLVRLNDLFGNDRVLRKKNTKFGMSQNMLDDIKKLIKENNFISLEGIHFHYDEFDPEIKAGSIDNLLNIFYKLYADGFSPTIINIGGGFRGRELENVLDWERYISFLSQAKLNNLPTDTWGDRAYGIHVNDKGVIEGREFIAKRYREINSAKFLRAILTKEFQSGKPIFNKINEGFFKLIIEPGYALSINTGFTILRVESYKVLNNGDEAIFVNANIQNLSSRMWEYFVDPILITKQDNMPNQDIFYGYILGNLCRDDDILIQRKVYFNHKPNIGDLIVLVNTSPYISDFEDGNPIQQEQGRKFVAKKICDSIQIFNENSYELI